MSPKGTTGRTRVFSPGTTRGEPGSRAPPEPPPEPPDSPDQVESFCRVQDDEHGLRLEEPGLLQLCGPVPVLAGLPTQPTGLRMRGKPANELLLLPPLSDAILFVYRYGK
ncbi:hypothetical protein EYF80_030774 [Liparis tanakae]|uniref:Uncharacterized protein n=1 Tax=Liparis tanakae TaxID=230148 RepID=A0A4Z2GZU1_9TELE|nr:hypothetical protein EYF80_030774 [Liparis tanakae]